MASEEARPRFDPVVGRVVWEPPAPVAIEPAFVREAIASLDESAENVTIRPSQGVTTFADVYPRGTKDHADSDALTTDDPLAEWRVDDGVADDILIALPDSTPRMIRTLLTLILGGMRGRPDHS